MCFCRCNSAKIAVKIGARQGKFVKTMMKKWKLYKTSVYFITIYVGLFICICLYRFIEGSDETVDAVVASAGIWGLCLFQNFQHPDDDPIANGDCNAYPEVRPNVGAMATMMTMIICLGFGMFLIYGWRKEHFKMWKNELAAKGLGFNATSVRNASNVNGTMMSSRAGDDDKKKKKKGNRFFANSVAASSAVSSNATSGAENQGSADESDSKVDYMPDQKEIKGLKKKEKEITKLDKKYGASGNTCQVESVREDLTSFTMYILSGKDWPLKVPDFLGDRDGAADDLRDVLALMVHAATLPELQGWVCAKYTYEPADGSEDHLKPIISAQDQRQALLGVKYHWNSGDFLWIKHVSKTQVCCHKMTAEDFATVAHSFDPQPVLEGCKGKTLEEVHASFMQVCVVDTSCPYW
jgi:hypothetical protein